FLARKSALTKQRLLLEEKQRDAGQTFEEWMGICERAFTFAVYAPCWFAEGDEETRRTIMRTFGSNLRLLDKKLLIKLENPLLVPVEDTLKTIPEGSPDFAPLEPGETLEFAGQFNQFRIRLPDLLRRWDVVRTSYLETNLSSIWRIFDTQLFDELMNASTKKAA